MRRLARPAPAGPECTLLIAPPAPGQHEAPAVERDLDPDEGEARRLRSLGLVSWILLAPREFGSALGGLFPFLQAQQVQ